MAQKGIWLSVETKEEISTEKSERINKIWVLIETFTCLLPFNHTKWTGWDDFCIWGIGKHHVPPARCLPCWISPTNTFASVGRHRICGAAVTPVFGPWGRSGSQLWKCPRTRLKHLQWSRATCSIPADGMLMGLRHQEKRGFNGGVTIKHMRIENMSILKGIF